jgi:cytochrome oxidase assembly protein ShyY1
LNLATIRRWAPWLALVVVFAIATTLLSWWQFSRREEKVQKIQLVIANYDAASVPLEEILWTKDKAGNPVNEWRQVAITGSYLPDEALLVRNRPLSGSAGFLQLVPFELVSGEILIIERGWLRAGSDITAPETNPLPDSSFRTLEVRLRPSEPGLGKESVIGQVASIDLNEVGSLVSPEVITDFYGRLVSETPESAELPIAMPKPSLDEGNHLSYALQWLLFGIMAFGAFIWAYRNDKRIRLEAQGVISSKKKRQTQADLDASFEDQNQ